MPFNFKKLEERRAEILNRLEAMLHACNTETRAFNDGEQQEYTQLIGELRSIDATLDAAEQAGKYRQTERRSAGGTGASKEELEERAFAAYIRGTVADEETRAAVNMTTTDNGAVIPTSIARKIIDQIKEISPIAARASQYNVSGNVTIPVYDESSSAITMAYADEFTALTSNVGKFKSVTLGGFLSGALAKLSQSLINKTDFDLVAYVVWKLSEAAALWTEKEVLNGTSSKIEGISTVTPTVTAAASTAVTADELIDLQEAVPDRFQANCIWIMHKKTRSAIRKLKNSDGDYLLNKDFTTPWNYSLLGSPVYVSDQMPTMAANNRAIVYLDCSGVALKIGEKPNIQVLRERFADEHAVGAICWMEIDSKAENAQKISVLKMGAGG